jgi:hypothetical protein
MEAQFWSLVDKSGDCWLWKGRVEADYGMFSWYSQTFRPHRLAFSLTKGIISEGLEIDHICFTPLCCNPEHLRPATRAQNAAHRRKMITETTSKFKGVSASGKNWRATISKEGQGEDLGTYHSEEEAAVAYNRRAKELFQEFAVLNEVGDCIPVPLKKTIGKSGEKGITEEKKTGKWKVGIWDSLCKKSRYFGTFETIGEAVTHRDDILKKVSEGDTLESLAQRK